MSPTLPESLLRTLRARFDASPIACSAVGGGCIATALRIRLSSGQTIFAKFAKNLPADAFPAEADGLATLRRALNATDANTTNASGGQGEQVPRWIPTFFRTPRVLHVDAACLLLEWIEPGRPEGDFMARFGRAFADLHRIRGEHFGYHRDNYLGATPQPNTSRSTSWSAFFYSHRLEYQLRLAEQNGLADAALRAAVHALESKIDAILADSAESPTLLHGDLWSGNFLADSANMPVLIDPAVYYGHREADLAITHLFGGFSPAFYAAYEEAHPLPPGELDRRPLYQAWHLLNHLNLFGRSYYHQALAALRRYV